MSWPLVRLDHAVGFTDLAVGERQGVRLTVAVTLRIFGVTLLTVGWMCRMICPSSESCGVTSSATPEKNGARSRLLACEERRCRPSVLLRHTGHEVFIVAGLDDGLLIVERGDPRARQHRVLPWVDSASMYAAKLPVSTASANAPPRVFVTVLVMGLPGPTVTGLRGLIQEFKLLRMSPGAGSPCCGPV